MVPTKSPTVGEFRSPPPHRTVENCPNLLRIELVGVAGFEPATTRTPSVCATRLRHTPTGV
jgi:hypothetical protein